MHRANSILTLIKSAVGQCASALSSEELFIVTVTDDIAGDAFPSTITVESGNGFIAYGFTIVTVSHSPSHSI